MGPKALIIGHAPGQITTVGFIVGGFYRISTEWFLF